MNLTEGQRTTYLKFIHDRLPCNQRENKYYQYKSPMCLVCTNEIESNDHILRCTKCQERTKSRKKYIEQLQRIMTKMGTNTTTTRVIIAHLRVWLGDTTGPKLVEVAQEASTELKQAIEDQEKIGWDQWFKGRISLKWGELYNEDIKKPNILITRPSSLRWGRSVILETIKFMLEVWQIRNMSEHDMLGNQNERRKEKLSEQLLWELNKSNSMNKGIQTSQNELKQLPVENLEMMLVQAQMYNKKKLK
jgi:hypothetical protein